VLDNKREMSANVQASKYRGAQIRGVRSTERISIVRLRLNMWILSVELDSFHCFDVWSSEVENFLTHCVRVNCRVEQVRSDFVDTYGYQLVEQVTRSAHVDTTSEPLKSTVRYFTGEGSRELSIA
jgi:hypothetical protein